jgi:BASS family bile acid:Na+ symporter
LLGHFFQMPISMQPWPIAELVLMTVFAPLAAGILVRRFLPAIALRISKTAARVGAVALLLCFAPVLFTAWPAIVALIGNGAVVAIAAFVVAGLLVGHALGGPDSQDRTVLALATATRHPGVALAIATTNFPQQKAVLPAILLYIILGAIITIPYVLWRKRVAAREE